MNSKTFLFGAVTLLSTAMAFGEVQTTVDHNANGDATEQFKFKNVPSPAPDNLAAKTKFIVVSGDVDSNSGDVSVLTDGKLPSEEDQPDSNFFFGEGTAGGRVEADLGSAVAIKQINTYSWHPNTRGPQVYKLYASDGTADGFNAKPGSDVNPEQAGWKLIASVDTRPQSGDGGGQYGVSLSDSTGALGKFRYLLFDISKTESDDSFGNTFYSEINVIAADNNAGGETANASAAVQVPLAALFNDAGIYPDGVEFSGGLDDTGFACSSNVLGSAQVWNGAKFNVGSASATNVVTCAGQTIDLPAGTFSSLQILAAAVNGDQESQNFTVNYADPGSPQPVTQNVSDWFTPENYSGEARAVSMEYRNQSDGTKDERPFYLYGYAISLNKANAVKSLKLPDNANVKIFAITLVP
jgi:hypothetical protein